MPIGDFAWGVIVGSAITFAGSILIYWLQGRREKSDRKRIIKLLMRELGDVYALIDGDMFGMFKDQISLLLFNRAREIGALSELPDLAYVDVIKAYGKLVELRFHLRSDFGAEPVTMAALRAVGLDAEYKKGLLDAITAAKEAIRKYLDC